MHREALSTPRGVHGGLATLLIRIVEKLFANVRAGSPERGGTGQVFREQLSLVLLSLQDMHEQHEPYSTYRLSQMAAMVSLAWMPLVREQHSLVLYFYLKKKVSNRASQGTADTL
jgi:hypothetical protein